MNRCGFSGSDDGVRRVEAVVCPKPRRLAVLDPCFDDCDRSSRGRFSQQMEACDSRAGRELLDIILTKGGYGGERSPTQVASSPPFFSGSPPTRASNPLIQDAQFGAGKIEPPPPLSPSSSAHSGGGCVQMKFTHQPAAVRIEGFDCLSRDRRSCSISAMA